MASFATPDEVAELLPRTLTPADKKRAQFYLDAVARKIRRIRPGIEPNDGDARTVSIDIVLHAVALPIDLVGHTAYSKTVGARSKSGSIDPARIGKMDWQDWHYELLSNGEPTDSNGDPMYYFGDGPYDELRNQFGLPVSGLGRPSVW